MRRYIVIFLLLAPVLSFAQTDAQIETQMGMFVNFYNQKDSDGICSLMPRMNFPETGHDCFWKWYSRKTDHYAEYGRIKSFVYAGVDTSDPELVRVYRVVFEKAGTKAISFTLEKGKFHTFRFDTSSDEIEEMIKKVK